MAPKSQSQIVIENCPLVDWAGPGFCCGCNKDLKQAYRRWCSYACEEWFTTNHVWGEVRKAAIKRDKMCMKCGSTNRRTFEVNHLRPVLGKHSQMGCHHHLDGVELLCHACHLEITKQQRRDGEFKK